jgi:hypothetical protein
MKKIIFVLTSLFGAALSLQAQQQIGNSDFELWENVGTDTEEPINWNGFMTAQGGLTWAAAKQCERATDTRPGSSGTYSARVYSRSAAFGIVANGNLTLGRINMGNSTPSSTSNYNVTKISESNFSETLTNSPDSIVFWVKFNAASGSTSARMHAIIHDSYELRDPIDAGSSPYVVATAVLNYPSTNSGWVRKSVPFDYLVQVPSVNPQFILLTFTTNQTPGGGSAGDEVFIDDVQLIYNPTGGGGDENLPIVANDANVQTPFNTPIVIDMNNYLEDPENDIDFSTLSVTSTPLGGTAVANTSLGTITYTPNSGFWGDDQFNYSVCDGGEPQTCDNGTIFVTIDEELGLTSTVLDQVVILVKNQTLRITGADENVLVDLMDVRGSIIAKGNATTIFDIEQHKGILLVRLTSSLKHRVVRIANL